MLAATGRHQTAISCSWPPAGSRWPRLPAAAIKAAAQLKLVGPPPEPPRCELRVRGRLHSRARDRAVIAGHYDLPAAFYQLILEPTMAYSCAYWSADQTGQTRSGP